MNKELIVVCNGGSLRNFDFKSIDRDKYSILITGKAFRYFRKNRIDYDYYCCIDDAVSKSCEWEICREIKQKNIKCLLTVTAGWSVETVKIFRKNNHKVGFLEDLKKKENNAFSQLEDKYTTGSCGLLFGMFLEYKKINILGLDNDYVNTGNVRTRPDGKREIFKDLVGNPNYFFDNYERTGDVKNAPNNIENLHTDSIIKAIDIADVNNIELINYNNKKSFSDNIKTLPLNKFDK